MSPNPFEAMELQTPRHATRPQWRRTALAACAVAAAGVLGVTAPSDVPGDARGAATTAVDKDAIVAESVGAAFAPLDAAAAVTIPFADTLLAEELVASGGVAVDEVPYSGAGTFTVVPGSAPAPDPAARSVTLLIRAEDGAGVDAQVFADQSLQILNDPRGWGPIDGVSFARTDDPAAADLTLTIASPSTTEELCGELPTRGYTSCGRISTVNINAARWAHGADAFSAAGGSLEEYRAYLLNHEVGHPLGHWHVECPAPGQPAPVMLQQTLRLQGCVPNGWPGVAN